MTVERSVKLHDLLEDYATRPVPRGITVGGFRIALINTALAFSLPALLTGAQLSSVARPGEMFTAILVGGLIVAVIGTAVGIVGVRNRLSTYMLLAHPFGVRGAVLVNLCMALSLFGWFGVNVHLFGQAGSELTLALTDYRLGSWVFVLAGGILMTAGAICGFKSIQRLATLIVPLQVVVVALLARSLFAGTGMGEPAASPPEAGLTQGESISAVVGSFIVAAVIMSDFTRYGASWRDAAVASFVPYFIAATVTYSISAFAASATGESDIIRLMIHAGLGLFSFVLVIVSSWITNSVNLYGCSLSIAAVFPRLGEWKIAVLSGLTGIGVAFMGILDHYIDFIYSLSFLFAPVAGILLADYFVVHRGKYELGVTEGKPKISGPAILAWFVAVALTYGGDARWSGITGIGACDSLLIGAVCYLLLTKSRSILQR